MVFENPWYTNLWRIVFTAQEQLQDRVREISCFWVMESSIPKQWLKQPIPHDMAS